MGVYIYVFLVWVGGGGSLDIKIIWRVLLLVCWPKTNNQLKEQIKHEVKKKNLKKHISRQYGTHGIFFSQFYKIENFCNFLTRCRQHEFCIGSKQLGYKVVRCNTRLSKWMPHIHIYMYHMLKKRTKQFKKIWHNLWQNGCRTSGPITEMNTRSLKKKKKILDGTYL